MTLHFETFETVAFFLASLVVVLLIQDGKSNYLEGLLCLGMYTIIALAFYVLPGRCQWQHQSWLSDEGSWVWWITRESAGSIIHTLREGICSNS